MTSILEQARRELAEEQRLIAVEREKARLRARRSLWRRLLDALPFTITWKQRT